MDDFIVALHREIEMYADYGRGVEFDTIFFGGGTPSLLTPQQLEAVLSRLHATFAVRGDAEITLETNPGTVTPEKLSAYRNLGVNRLSIGIQSFHEDELKFLGRIHDRAQAIRCVELARQAGFDNLNIDLIYALPGQTIERWAENLRMGLGLQPEHVSAYGLIVEEGTPLARMVNAKQVSPAPLEQEAEFYEFTMEFMAAVGYEHYEVSNYARPGLRSRHNYNYWAHGNYLGFGPSAHSFWKHSDDPAGRRWWNISNISHYNASLQRNELPLVTHESVSRNDLIVERILLGLRSDGVDLRKLRIDYGFDLMHRHKDIIDQLAQENRIVLENESLLLTAKGYLLCDEISERLMP